MSRRRFLVALLLVAGVALAGRVAYVLAETRHQEIDITGEGRQVRRSFDELYYVGTAEHLADGKGFRRPPFFGPADVEAADHPPLTSIVLAPVAWLFDDSELAMRFTMALLGAGVVVVVGLTARHLAGPAAGLVAAVLAAAYPAFWMNDGLLMAETLAALTTAGVLLLLVRLVSAPSWPGAVAVGVLCGLAMLARGELALLVPVACLAVVIGAGGGLVRRVAVAGAVAVVAAVVVAPWVAYNMGRFDDPVFLSTGEGGVLAGANCDATYHGPYTAFWLGTCGAEIRGSDPSVVSVRQRKQAFRYIGDNLDRFPVVVAARLGRAWGFYRPGQTADINQAEGRPVWASVLGYASLLLLVPAALVGARELSRRRVPVTALVGPLVIAVFVVAAFYGIPRFRIAGEPALVVLAGVGIAGLLTGGRGLRRA